MLTLIHRIKSASGDVGMPNVPQHIERWVLPVSQEGDVSMSNYCCLLAGYAQGQPIEINAPRLLWQVVSVRAAS